MARELKAEDFSGKVVLLNIVKNWENGMEDTNDAERSFSLYEASRGSWVMNYDEAQELDYAIPVHDGKIIEVYKVVKWCHENEVMRNPAYVEPSKGERCDFVGRKADDDIRSKYIGNTVREMYEWPKQNSVRIFIDGKLKTAK